MYFKGFPSTDTPLNKENLSRSERFTPAEAGANGDFKINIDGADGLEINDIVRVYFGEATNGSKKARLSIDDGVTYYDIKSRDAKDIENKTAVLHFDGEFWIPVGGEALFKWTEI